MLDLHPGPGPSNPAHFTPFGDRLIFAADDGIHGQELWHVPLTDLG